MELIRETFSINQLFFGINRINWKCLIHIYKQRHRPNKMPVCPNTCVHHMLPIVSRGAKNINISSSATYSTGAPRHVQSVLIWASVRASTWKRYLFYLTGYCDDTHLSIYGISSVYHVMGVSGYTAWRFFSRIDTKLSILFSVVEPAFTPPMLLAYFGQMFFVNCKHQVFAKLQHCFQYSRREDIPIWCQIFVENILGSRNIVRIHLFYYLTDMM